MDLLDALTGVLVGAVAVGLLGAGIAVAAIVQNGGRDDSPDLASNATLLLGIAVAGALIVIAALQLDAALGAREAAESLFRG